MIYAGLQVKMFTRPLRSRLHIAGMLRLRHFGDSGLSAFAFRCRRPRYIFKRRHRYCSHSEIILRDDGRLCSGISWVHINEKLNVCNTLSEAMFACMHHWLYHGSIWLESAETVP